MSDPGAKTTPASPPALARRLGLFDATMIVMGGIIGVGIFKNPASVAGLVDTPGLALGAWVIGGVIAVIGAFVYAELAAIRPRVGGQYAYLRDAYNPMLAFLYGWTLLLVTQTGGMAAAAVNFAHYLNALTHWQISSQVIAVATLALLTVINCLGVRSGSNVQSALMVTKLLAIATLIIAGWFWLAPADESAATAPERTPGHSGFAGLAAAMVPVLFAYGGWQTASFMSGEMKNPSRDLPRGLLIGVGGVIVVYLAVAYVCQRGLGFDGLAKSETPASDVMKLVWGEKGAKFMALAISISTVGFLSQCMLTAPRVYYAMARDGVFFRAVGRLNPHTQAPVLAIIVQGVWAAVIAASGTYDQINNYVVSIDALFFGLTGASLIIFRRRERRASPPAAIMKRTRVPGHPFTTAVFVLACWGLALNTIWKHPGDAGIGVIILVLGLAAYGFWRWKQPAPAAAIDDGAAER